MFVLIKKVVCWPYCTTLAFLKLPVFTAIHHREFMIWNLFNGSRSKLQIKQYLNRSQSSVVCCDCNLSYYYVTLPTYKFLVEMPCDASADQLKFRFNDTTWTGECVQIWTFYLSRWPLNFRTLFYKRSLCKLAANELFREWTSYDLNHTRSAQNTKYERKR